MQSSVVSTAPAASVPRKRPGCPRRARPYTTWNSTSALKGEDPHSSPFSSGHLPPWGPHCSCTFKCYLCANSCPDQTCSSDFALQLQTQASKCWAALHGHPSSPYAITWPRSHVLLLPHAHLSTAAIFFLVTQGTES